MPLASPGGGDRPPLLTLIAGPHGAGKSCWAPRLLAPGTPLLALDDIQSELPESLYAVPAVAARRLLSAMIGECVRHRLDFALESRLAGRTLAGHVARLRREGYAVQLYWLALKSAELSWLRVCARSAADAPAVSRVAVERDFVRGGANLEALYLPLVDAALAMDNSAPDEPVILDRPSLPQTESRAAIIPGVAKQNLRLAVTEAVSESLRRGAKVACWRDGAPVLLAGDAAVCPPVGE